MSVETAYIIFYRISDGYIYSYTRYNFEYNGEILLNKPSKEKCAENDGVSEESIGMKKWNKTDPQESDFKDDIDDLTQGDLENI